MISATQEIYIRYTVQSYLNQGYKYYVVHTNTNLSNSSSNDWQDLTLYFSKDPITKRNDYSFTFQSGIRLDVITAGARTDRRAERVQLSNLSNSTIIIDNYEFILSNQEGRYMDVLGLQSYQEQTDISYNLTKNDYFIVPIILCILILFKWLHGTFKTNLKGRVVHEA